MPILSTLRTSAAAGARVVLAVARRKPLTAVPVKNMSGHKMEISASEYSRERVKDNIFFFLALGLVPLGTIVTFFNVKIGPAELRDTPEGYVPIRHEYHKSPISRFISYYLLDSEEKQHERTLYFLHKQNEQRKAHELNRKVKKLSRMRNDQKGWYYVPVSGTLNERIHQFENRAIHERK